MATVLSTAQNALAQSDPTILLPFQDERSAELQLDAFLFNKGSANARDLLTGEDPADPASSEADLTMFEGQGRFKLDHGRVPIRVGFDVTHLNLELHTDTGARDLELLDHAVAIGFGLAEFGDWQVAATVGGGFAGDDAYANSNAWYAKADLILSYTIDEVSSLQFVIDYNGNRTVLPDLPLPAVAYTRVINDTLTLTVGIPFNNILWTPNDRFTFKLQYLLPFNATVDAEYRLFDGVRVFAAFANRRNAYHIDADNRNRRVFFLQRRVEAGLRWKVCEFFELTAAGGYAFNQEFRYGFDARDDDELFDLSDEPYLRLGGAISF